MASSGKAKDASNAVQRAVEKGELRRPGKCETCDTSTDLSGHHHKGYGHPLDVWWICSACNRSLHGKHDGSLTIEQAREFVVVNRGEEKVAAARANGTSHPVWESRIVGHEKVDPRTLTINILNHRRHPKSQQEATAASILECGFIKSITVSKRSGAVIDGNDRLYQAQDTGQPTIDVEYVDLTPEQERKALLYLDATSEMAEIDPVKFDALLLQFDTEHDVLKEMLAALVKDSPVETDPETAQVKLDEQSQTLQEFIQRRKASADRGNDKAEQNFWVCLVFQSWTQKQEFLFAIKDTPVLYGMYANGEQLAARLGIQVTPNRQKEIKSPLDKKLAALVAAELIPAQT